MFLRFRRVPVNGSMENSSAKVSIIIPARNEKENLSRLLPSLLAQKLDVEIIVVDDHSSDGTAAVAEQYGARLVRGKDLPSGWHGKPWACQQGAEAAGGDWLLFLDADVLVEPGGLQRIISLAADREHVHSICPYHRVEHRYEELSAFFNVIMLLGMNAFTIRGDAARNVGLFGQAFFLSRLHYARVGGHEAVKREVLENFHLSRRFRSLGIDCRCYLGKGVLSMRMFPGGWRDLVAGWSKGFVSGANNTPRGAMVGISVWLSGLMMITVSLTFLPLAGEEARLNIGILYSLGVFQCLYLFKHAGNFAFVNAVFFPLALVFYQVVFFLALRRKRVGGQIQWKGRDVG